jgi:hypothetical protein
MPGDWAKGAAVKRYVLVSCLMESTIINSQACIWVTLHTENMKALME